MSKKASIYELAKETQDKIATPSEWMRFLETQCWHYKTYSFPSQLLIYAQRPDTKACAAFDEWNQCGRHVKRNSKGIALIEESKNQLELKYVFAVEDTYGKSIEQWNMEEEHLLPVKDTLSKAYQLHLDDISSLNTEEFVLKVSRAITDEHLDTYFEQLKNIIDKCPNLSAFSEEEIRMRFQGLMQYSLAYTVLKRLELPTTDTLFHSRFLDISNFKDTYALTALGAAQHDLSQEVLNEIEHTVKGYNKNRNKRVEEIAHEHQLSESERISDSRNHDSERDSAYQVRDAAQTLSERSETGSISRDAVRRDIDGASSPDGNGSEGTLWRNNEESIASKSGTGEISGESGMDQTYGNLEPNRGRNRSDGSNLSLEDIPAEMLEYAFLQLDQKYSQIRPSVAKEIRSNGTDESLAGVLNFYHANATHQLLYPDGKKGSIELKQWAHPEDTKIKLQYGEKTINLGWDAFIPVVRKIDNEKRYLDEAQELKLKEFYLREEEAKSRWERYHRYESILADNGFNLGPQNPAFRHLYSYIFENSETGKYFISNVLKGIIDTKGEAEKQRAIELLSELEVNESFLADEEILPSASDHGLDVIFPTEAEQLERLSEKHTEQVFSQESIDFILKSALLHKSKQDIYLYFKDNPSKEDGIEYVKQAFSGENRDILLPDGETIHISSTHNGLSIENNRTFFLSYETAQSRIRNLISFNAYLSDSELRTLTTVDSRTNKLEKGTVVSFGGSDYKIIDIQNNKVILQDVIFPIFTKTMEASLLEQILLQQSIVSEPIHIIQPEESPMVSDSLVLPVEKTINQAEEITDGDLLLKKDTAKQEAYCYYVTDSGSNSRFRYPNEKNNKPEFIADFSASTYADEVGLWVQGYVLYQNPLSDNEIKEYGLYPYTPVIQGEDGKEYILQFSLQEDGITVFNQRDNELEKLCHITNDFVADEVKDDLPDNIHNLLDNYISELSKNKAAQIVSEKDIKSTEDMVYRYYSRSRTIGPGGLPKTDGNTPVQIVNFESREWVPEFGDTAWGYADYHLPLSESAQNDYELFYVPRPLIAADGISYQLGFEKTANGTLVFNKLDRLSPGLSEESSIAHIDHHGAILYHRNNVPNEVQTLIQSEAKKLVPKKKKTAENRNYEWLKKYAPDIVSGKYDYMRFENPDKDSGYMPLYIEKIGPSQIAMAHYTYQYGDLILDPEVVFHIDHEKEELKPLSFEMSGLMYQTVYAYHDTNYENPDLRVQKDIQTFLNTWKKNILEQTRYPSLAQKDGISYTFENGIAHPVDTSDPTIAIKEDIPSTDGSLSKEDEVLGNLLDLLDMYKPDDPDFLEFSPDVADEIEELSALSYKPDNPKQNLASIESLAHFLLEWAPDMVDEEERKQFDRILDSAVNLIKTSAIPEIPVEKEPTLFDFAFEEAEPVLPYAGSAVETERINYKNKGESIYLGGPKARFQSNVEAIKLLKTLEEENRLANRDEMEILSRYVGWGGLSMAFDESNASWKEEYALLRSLLSEEEYLEARESTLTAFYTPPEVTEAIFDTIKRMGFRKGNILEPCCGTGNFFGSLPDEMAQSRLYGIEKDSLSGRIAKELYQNSNIQITGYEKANLPDSFFDLAIGNVPFGDFKLADKRYDKHNFMIHDYFFAKTLDKVRPGGIVCFITSKGTLDKANPEVRRYLAERADLLGAVRLPNNTFKQNAGTEVTSDIIFLKKREEPRINDADWIHLERNDDGIPINSYFLEHPEMMLGKMIKTTGYAGREVFECVADKEFHLKSALNNALRNIETEYTESIFMDYDEAEPEDRTVLEASPDVKNFSYTIVDGDIYFRENSKMYQVETNATAMQRIKGLVHLRNTVNELIDAQMYDRGDGEIHYLQNKLSDEYDSFTSKFGIINSRANELAFSQDSSYFLLCSLENVNDKGEFISKADMFYKRTIGRNEEITHCDSPIEALMVSIAEKGRVDFYYMQHLLDNAFSFEEIKDSLKGHIFRDPALSGDDYNCFLPADEYLSGNVRKKLKLAEEAAIQEPELYEENIKQLREVLPEWIEAADIIAKLGATWIPDTDIDLFFKDLLNINPNYWYGKNQQVHFSDVTNSWQVDNKTMHNGELASVTYGTKRRNAAELLEQALNLKTPEIYDEVYDYASERYKRVKNVDETIRAIEKQEMIQKAFDDWVWKDPERRERLTKIYNERFNCIRNREFNGEGLRFHGITPSIELKPHQKDAIARIILGGNTMLAHCVGAGKTFEMVSAAMEMKAMGLSNKNMIVVPNHLIKQFAAEALQLYPAANILGATKKDFEPRNRKKFCSRIATGDYDLVIIGHSQFERIPLSIERQKATIEAEIQEIVQEIAVAKQEQDQRFSVKEMERTKKSLETQLEKLNDQSRKDDVITFEQLGIDRLFIDEAHGFKNLFIKTKMNRVAGLSTASAQKSMDLFMKCRYMDEKTGNRGNIHATGTPVSNSLVELYTTQRYLQYDLLMDLGLHHFDSWASAFTEQKTVMELAPEGNGYRMKTRLAKFHNIPELMALYKECADIKTQDMLNLDIPEAHYETIVTKPSEFQLEYVKELGKRAEKIRGGMVDSRDDNMLLITNDGRKLALDQRLVNPNAGDWEESKISSCADKIAEVYQKTDAFKGTQLVFCDLSTPVNTISMKKNADKVYEMDYEFTDVYHDLKQKLIERGIPENEIRFIHEANTELQKENLFEKVRSGEVRVLMGSTQKMGAGTNVQNRLYAIHDLDAPWRPSDLEQRSGRIVRQGNSNDDVYIYRYITENTFDAYLFQLLENKQWFCSQIMTSKSPLRVAEDIDEITISFAELKALAAGNPLIKERTELDIELNRLRGLKSDFLKEKHAQENRIHTYYPIKIEETKQKLSAIKKDLDRINTSDILPDAESGYQLMRYDTYYNKKNYKELDDVFREVFKNTPAGERKTIGIYRGFELQGSKQYQNSTYPDHLYLVGSMSYKINDGKLSSLFGRMNFTLENRIEELLEEQTLKLSNLEDERKNAIAQIDAPFHREEELRQKETRLKELDDLLSLEEDIPSEEEIEAKQDNSVSTQGKKRLEEMIADADQVKFQAMNLNNTYTTFEK